MIINNDKKFIFVHLPKNGGNTITHTLPGAGHESLNLPHWHVTAEAIGNVVHNYDDYFRFGFVRNPFDRLYSMYRYSVGLIHRLKVQPNYIQNGMNFYDECDFKTWLIEKESWASWDTGRDYLPAQKEQQLSYLAINGDIVVDYVARFENFTTEFEYICSEIDVNYSKPPLRNASTRKKDYMSVYDNEMIDFVQKHHQTDLERFNYG